MIEQHVMKLLSRKVFCPSHSMEYEILYLTCKVRSHSLTVFSSGETGWQIGHSSDSPPNIHGNEIGGGKP